MKYILFGDSGYIGKHLKRKLEAGCDEVMLPRGDHGSRIDLTDASQLLNVDWDVDYVMCFAGRTGTSLSFNQPQEFIVGNEVTLVNVLQAISKSKFRPRIIFPSSRLVYAGNKDPIGESAKKECKTIYSVSKLACENMLYAYSAAYSIPYSIYRICVPYANSIDNFFSYGTVGSFIKQADENKVIRLYGDGSLRRTFTHIDDLIEIIYSTSRIEDDNQAIYNIPGCDLSLVEAAELIAKKFNARIEYSMWPDFDLSLESGSTVFECSKIKNKFGIMPKNTFRQWAKSSAY